MTILSLFFIFLGFLIFCFGLYLLSCGKRIDDVYVIPVCGPDTPEYIKEYLKLRKRENRKYILGIFWIEIIFVLQKGDFNLLFDLIYFVYLYLFLELF